MKSFTFRIPIISIGNLSVGGTGKSPMTMYLAERLKGHNRLAILSRGYGRKTKGFLFVGSNDTTRLVGDEPLQLKLRFPDLTVAVCENRVRGIEKLIKEHDLILMDDAYQHRAVKPGLSILLFDFNNLFKPQWLLPTGELREPFWGRKRANVIIITKAPSDLSQEARQHSILRINPYPYQHVFFSVLEYSDLHPLMGTKLKRTLDSITNSTRIILLTGIANPKPLIQKLKYYTNHIDHHDYPDHHPFDQKNMLKLVTAYEGLSASDKLVITTEKDAQRLKDPALRKYLNTLSIYYLPVQAMMHNLDKQKLDDLIETFMRKFDTRISL